MKSSRFVIFLVLFLSGGGFLHAQLINVDFNQNNGVSWGGGGPNPGPTMSGAAVLGAASDDWNGMEVNSGSGMALIEANGSLSPVTMTFTSDGGYNVNSFDGSTPFAGTPYDDLMQDYLYTSGTTQTITLSGLATNSAYRLVLYNAGNTSAAGRTTFFTVNSNTLSSTWDAASSTLIPGVDYVEFTLALSDGSGNLVITYNGDGTAEGDVDGFQIQAAPPVINAAGNQTNAIISFPTQAGFSYQLQYKTNLAEAGWISLGVPATGSNMVRSVNDSVNQSARFYRLQISALPAPALSLLHAAGTNIANASGHIVLLQGLNLGGWFIMEKWMCPLDSGSLPDTYSVITNLDSRFGVSAEQSLIHGYQTNWITVNDLNNITNAGFNCVRMPVWWGNFYSITNTTSTGWRSDAFTVLDWLVTNCATRGIYVVIDMHGVVGGQSTSGDTGWQNQNQYWTNSVDQLETAYMWSQIAAHYRGNPAVAGYDLINEPSGAPAGTGSVWPAYASLYNTIRAVDPSHMLILEGTFGNWDWSMLPNPAAYSWTNIVYSMHEYQYGGTVAQIEGGSDNQVTDFDNHLSWNVPGYIGEWNDMGQGAACYDYSINDYANAGMGWSMWAYKATDGLVPDGWGWYDPTYWPNTPNISSDSLAAIANDWLQWRTTTSFGVNAAVGL
jgi:endoglucanase